MSLLLPAVWRVSDMQAGRKENKFRLNIWLISHTHIQKIISSSLIYFPFERKRYVKSCSLPQRVCLSETDSGSRLI